MRCAGSSSRIFRNHILREILWTTLLSTLVLTAILIYGNLSKHDHHLFQALSVSPILFLELITLMLPFGLSLGLPFGFSLAVIFCVGRWSADREILALQSLGNQLSLWMKPILFVALVISLFGCLLSLQWAPYSRGLFDQKLSKMVWEDFQLLIDRGDDFSFDLKGTKEENPLSGLDFGIQSKITQSTLSVGYGEGDIWNNVRLLLWGEKSNLLGILHAKSSKIKKDKENGILELQLFGVDYESLENNLGQNVQKSNFVSFEKWKQPIRFKIDTQEKAMDVKRISFFDFLNMNPEDFQEKEYQRAQNNFNKYASLGLSPLSLCPLLISMALRSGRRETYANLFLGVFICLIYFAISSTLGHALDSNGYGWWITNFFAGISGIFIVSKQKFLF